MLLVTQPITLPDPAAMVSATKEERRPRGDRADSATLFINFIKKQLDQKVNCIFFFLFVLKSDV
jgi:hypothetical protein